MNLKANSPLLTAVIPINELESHYQSFRDWVCKANTTDLLIVVINDNQKEHTAKILMSLQRELPFGALKVLNGNSKGPGSARNLGLAEAKSPWVTFWDVDDLPQVDKILVELKKIQVVDAEILVGAFITVDPLQNLITQAKVFSSNQKQNLFQIAFEPGLWRFCFKTSTLEGIKFPEIYMGEDQVFIARCDIENKNIFYSNKVFYHYVKGNSGQLTNSTSAKKDLALAIESVSSILNSRPGSQTTKIQLFRLILSGLLRGDFLTKIKSLLWLLKAIAVNRELSLKDLRTLMFLLMRK